MAAVPNAVPGRAVPGLAVPGRPVIAAASQSFTVGVLTSSTQSPPTGT